MLGSNSFDGLETYYLPYESNPLTHKLPKAIYDEQMKSKFGANDTSGIQKIYDVEGRFGGDTNAVGQVNMPSPCRLPSRYVPLYLLPLA